MKLQVVVTRTRTEVCDIEVPDLATAKKEIEALLPDDFGHYDSYYNLEIVNEDGKDITGEIQPFTPRLDVD